MKGRRKKTSMPSQIRNSDRHQRSRLAMLLGTTLVVCCTGLTLVGWARSRHVSTSVASQPGVTRQAQSSSIQSIPPSGSSIQRMDIEVITIRPTGFERTEITRPKGLFGIAVENRSGLADMALRLDQEGGLRLRQAQLSSKKLAWKDVLDVPPGRYVLTEASNPSWLCSITITEN